MTINLVESMTEHPALDGKLAKVVELKNSQGMSATFMDIGATWLSCRIPQGSKGKELLLGLASMPDFERHTTYLGATVGRFANRIEGGMFSIDGEVFNVLTNQGDNTLHGGPEGFNKRRWEVYEQTQNKVIYGLISPDGDQGFPGNLIVRVCYQLNEENELVIRYSATTDRATPINLTNHAYFNLDNADGNSDCLNHKIQINAQYYLPTTPDGIPLGDIASVENTAFDFTKLKLIGDKLLSDEQQIAAKGYDHSYVFRSARDKTEPVAILKNSDESIAVEVYTDKPAMQFYTGNWNGGTPSRTLEPYSDYSGVALETQYLPDAPNRPCWAYPDAILYPSEEYQSVTKYRFLFS